MKFVKFPTDTNANVLNRAFEKSFEKFKVPIEERKDAKEWHFVKQDVSKQMGYKLLGRPVPIKNRGMKPTIEVLRMAHTTDLPRTIYPRKAKTSIQKFQILQKLLLVGEIDFPTFKEFSQVLDINTKKIQQTVNQALSKLF